MSSNCQDLVFYGTYLHELFKRVWDRDDEVRMMEVEDQRATWLRARKWKEYRKRSRPRKDTGAGPGIGTPEEFAAIVRNREYCSGK